MKLLSCYVENFGGLHQYAVTFRDGLTVIDEANGSGKTTLATFIRCMFYGMPRPVRDLGKDYRRRFEPWQGGSFGGQLTLDVAGQVYRIERTFGSSAKEDTLVVYDETTGLATDELGIVPGITLFGLDADSFERSAYMPQDHSASSLATSGIKAKLGNMMEDTDGVHNFESAMKLLRGARASRAAFRGEAGTYYDLTAEISQVSDSITQITTAQGELDRVIGRVQRAEQAIESQREALSQVRDELQKASTLATRRAKALECKRLDDACSAAQQRRDALAAAYVRGVPSEEQLQRALEAQATLDLAKQAGIEAEPLGNAADFADVDPDELRRKQAATARSAGAKALACAVLGAPLALAGIVLAALDATDSLILFAAQLPMGIALALAGVVLCILAGVFKRKLQQRYTAPAPSLDPSFAQLKQRAAAAQQALQAFSQAYGLTEHPLTQSFLMGMLGDLHKMQAAEQELSAAEQAFSEFVAARGLCSWSREDEERYRSLNLDALTAEESRLLDALDAAMMNHAKDSQRVQALRERMGNVAQLHERQAALTERRKEVGREVSTIDSAMVYLQKAKESIAVSYAGTIQARFQYYLTLLLGPEMAKAQIDTDFGVHFTQGGATRSFEHLSAGYADLVVVCMRMALVDALFTRESPFVIMDDPFINIDDELMPHAFDLLRKLSASRQVVYFTCSHSRNPEM